MKSWAEITVRTYEKILKEMLNKDKYSSETELGLRLVSIITGIDYKELLEYSSEQFNELAKELEFLNDVVTPSGKKEYIIKGRKFVALKNLNALTMGEAIDAEVIIKDVPQEKLLSSLLPILIREKVGKEIVKHSAEEYKKNLDLLQDNLSVADVIHIKDFF